MRIIKIEQRKYIMHYLDIFKEFIDVFPYREQVLVFIGGIVFAFLLNRLVLMIRIWCIKRKNRSRNMIVIEQQGWKPTMKNDGNARYFEYIKSAQYVSGNGKRDKKASE